VTLTTIDPAEIRKAIDREMEDRGWCVADPVEHEPGLWRVLFACSLGLTLTEFRVREEPNES